MFIRNPWVRLQAYIVLPSKVTWDNYKMAKDNNITTGIKNIVFLL